MSAEECGEEQSIPSEIKMGNREINDCKRVLAVIEANCMSTGDGAYTVNEGKMSDLVAGLEELINAEANLYQANASGDDVDSSSCLEAATVKIMALAFRYLDRDEINSISALPQMTDDVKNKINKIVPNIIK